MEWEAAVPPAGALHQEAQRQSASVVSPAKPKEKSAS